MMDAVLVRIDAVLSARPSLVRDDGQSRPSLMFAGLIVAFGGIYGVMMGSYGGVRGLQMLYSAVKLPLLLGVTFVISLPSFFVFNTLFGVRSDFRASLRALLATQAGLTIILASFAPFTAFWYISFADYEAAKCFNLAMFALASFCAQRLLRRFYQPLIDRDPRHRTMIRVWLVIFSFVGVQMAWLLRPFVGRPDAPTTFLREDAWGNAYIHVGRTVWQLLGG
jgi:hypothetical protein